MKVIDSFHGLRKCDIFPSLVGGEEALFMFRGDDGSNFASLFKMISRILFVKQALKRRGLILNRGLRIFWHGSCNGAKLYLPLSMWYAIIKQLVCLLKIMGRSGTSKEVSFSLLILISQTKDGSNQSSNLKQKGFVL